MTEQKTEIEIFGTVPAYLSEGLENWDEVCDEQALKGTRGLEEMAKGNKWVSFNYGVFLYNDGIRGDIGAIQRALVEEGVSHEFIVLPTERKSIKKYSTVGEWMTHEKKSKYIHPFMRELFGSDISEEDLVKAGSSYVASNAIKDSLEYSAKVGEADRHLVRFRYLDYDIHRVKLSDLELSKLMKSWSAKINLNDFWKTETDEERFDNIMTPERRKVEDDLRSEDRRLEVEWWRTYREEVRKRI